MSTPTNPARTLAEWARELRYLYQGHSNDPECLMGAADALDRAQRLESALNRILLAKDGPDCESWECDCCFHAVACGIAYSALEQKP